MRAIRSESRNTHFGFLAIAPSLVGAAVLLASCGSSANSSTPSTSSAPAANGEFALQQDFVRVVNAVGPSVVEISTTTGLGSGVIYDDKGDIVTNAHVVGDAKSFVVSLSNGKRLDGTLVGTYVPDDLAVVRVQPVAGLKPAHFGDSSALEVGDIVLAIGNPLGLSSSVTDGIVSFNGRAVSEGGGVVLPNLIQTSAAINPGNSGGALVDLSSQVIGIPTLAATNGSSAAVGLGFAIPSSTVELIAPQLIADGKVTTAGRAALGISGTTAVGDSGQAMGVSVTGVQANGPAAKSGIVVGDLITAIDGKATTELTELQTILAQLKPDKDASVAVTDANGAHRTVSVLLGDLAQT
jgi:putative serine protease PepD